MENENDMGCSRSQFIQEVLFLGFKLCKQEFFSKRVFNSFYLNLSYEFFEKKLEEYIIDVNGNLYMILNNIRNYVPTKNKSAPEFHSKFIK